MVPLSAWATVGAGVDGGMKPIEGVVDTSYAALAAPLRDLLCESTIFHPPPHNNIYGKFIC